MSDDLIKRLESLPEHERKRLAALSLSGLIARIEEAGFECQGGSLENFTAWMELKARAATAAKAGTNA